MRMTLGLPTIAVVLLVAAGVALAEDAKPRKIYRWTDDQGNVHFSTEMPPTGKAERYRVTAPPPGDSGTPTPKADSSAPKAPSGERVVVEDPEVTAARQKIRAENCRNARNNVQMLASGGRIKGIGPDGKERVFTDADIASHQSQARAEVDKYCGAES